MTTTRKAIRAGESKPFAAVDAFTRVKLQQELRALLKHRPTRVFVTHDVSEAIFVGDVIVGMSLRPRTIRRIISVNPEDRNCASAAYARKLSRTRSNVLA